MMVIRSSLNSVVIFCGLLIAAVPAVATADVQATGFFCNSGVKIDGVDEVQIYDTDALMKALSAQDFSRYTVDVDGATRGIRGDVLAANVYLYHELNQDQTPKYWDRPEKVNGCVSGVPYKQSNHATLQDLQNAAGWINQGSNTTVITAAPLDPNDLEAGISLDGYRLVLLYPTNNLRIWATPERAEVTSIGGQPDPGGARAFIWTIDENNPPAMPMSVYVEGMGVQLDQEGQPATSSIYWEPLSPVAGGSVALAYADAIRFTVEPIVWPSNESTAADLDDSDNWASKSTNTWNGFRLEPGWVIDQPLQDIINGESVTIRTRYPEIGGSDPMAIGRGPAGGQGPPIYSVGPDGIVKYEDGFELELEFQFDSGYVKINTYSGDVINAGMDGVMGTLDDVIADGGDDVVPSADDETVAAHNRTQLDLLDDSGVNFTKAKITSLE